MKSKNIVVDLTPNQWETVQLKSREDEFSLGYASEPGDITLMCFDQEVVAGAVTVFCKDQVSTVTGLTTFAGSTIKLHELPPSVGIDELMHEAEWDPAKKDFIHPTHRKLPKSQTYSCEMPIIMQGLG